MSVCDLINQLGFWQWLGVLALASCIAQCLKDIAAIIYRKDK
jgi:hypothetical protein